MAEASSLYCPLMILVVFTHTETREPCVASTSTCSRAILRVARLGLCSALIRVVSLLISVTAWPMAVCPQLAVYIKLTKPMAAIRMLPTTSNKMVISIIAKPPNGELRTLSGATRGLGPGVVGR